MKKLHLILSLILICLVDYRGQSQSIYNFEKLSFTYQPNEDKEYECIHEVENRLTNSWVISCPYYQSVKIFSVHLVVKKIERQIKPKTKLEILYWVTNRENNSKLPEFTGSTVWIDLAEQNWTEAIRLSQHVDNGLASLDVMLSL